MRSRANILLVIKSFPASPCLSASERRRLSFRVIFARTGSDNPCELKVAEVGALTTREARAEAKELLGKIAKGTDPREKKLKAENPGQKSNDPTLRQAWQRYLDAHMKRKGRRLAPKTDTEITSNG